MMQIHGGGWEEGESKKRSKDRIQGGEGGSSCETGGACAGACAGANVSDQFGTDDVVRTKKGEVSSDQIGLHQ